MLPKGKLEFNEVRRLNSMDAYQFKRSEIFLEMQPMLDIKQLIREVKRIVQVGGNHSHEDFQSFGLERIIKISSKQSSKSLDDSKGSNKDKNKLINSEE